MMRADPKQQRLVRLERTAERDAARQGIVAARRQLHATFAFRRRQRALHVDESRQRIGAVAGALRTAQHLDVLNVERRRNRADAAEIDIVDQEADRRIRRALVLLEFTDTANLKVTRTMAVSRPVQVRDHVDQFFEVLHRQLLDFIGIECRHTRGNLARRTLAEVRGDDDFLDGLGLRHSGCGKQETCEKGAGNRHEVSLSSSSSPYAGITRFRF